VHAGQIIVLLEIKYSEERKELFGPGPSMADSLGLRIKSLFERVGNLLGLLPHKQRVV
jgi:hypothetical protein